MACRAILHFNGVSQPVAFFRECSVESFLASVRDIIDAPINAPLRFRDVYGNIVFIQPSCLPDGMVLHVSIERGTPFRGQHTTVRRVDGWCRWARHQGGEVSADCQTFLNIGYNPYAAYTGTLPIAGKHYFRLTVSSRPFRTVLGLIPAYLASVPHDRHLFNDEEAPNWPFLLHLERAGRKRSGPSFDATDEMMALGIYIDSDARTMVITRDECPSCERWATRIDRIPVPAVFVLQSAKDPIMAMIQAAPLPPRGVYAGDDVRVSPPCLRVPSVEISSGVI